MGRGTCMGWIVAAIVCGNCLGAGAANVEPLGFPVYYACRIRGNVKIDGILDEPDWRQTSLGWGMSDSIQPNVLCPDPTLFRIGYDDRAMYVSLACYKRKVQADLPEHIWKPQETDIMDMQAVPRYARMRGVIPPTNTADILISCEGRTVTLHFEPPAAPTARVHDSLGERHLPVELTYAYGGGPDDSPWTLELRVEWSRLGFVPPADGSDWALNIYRDIRFFSNWAFIAWMRDWAKAEYSRYNLVDRFGRIVFVDRPDAGAIDEKARAIAATRGPVRVFTPDALLLVDSSGRIVRQRYAERLGVLRACAEEIFRDVSRCSNDLPYYPFFTQTQPAEHMKTAARRVAELRGVLREPPAWDDPAGTVARISAALPEAREGLYTYKKERLYRGLPE